MALDTINQMFRDIGSLTTTDVSDAKLQGTHILVALQYYNQICARNEAIGDFSAATVGTVLLGDENDNSVSTGALIDQVIALFTTYFAYQTRHFEKLDSASERVLYELYKQRGLELIASIFPNKVKLSNLGTWVPVNTSSSKPLNTVAVEDSTTTADDAT